MNFALTERMLPRLRSILAYKTSIHRQIPPPFCIPSIRHLSDGIRKRRLDVAIVGAPNAGKSQLLNVMTRASVAAVSRKRHTTREGILGARTVTRGDVSTQLLFVDTPGFLRSDIAEKVSKDLLVSAKKDIEYVDYTIIVVDGAARLSDDVKRSLIDLMIEAYKSKGRAGDSDQNNGERQESTNLAVDDKPASSDATSEAPQVMKEKKGHVEKKENLQSKKFAVVLNKADLVVPKSRLMDTAVEIGTIARTCLMGFGVDVDDPDEILSNFPTFFYTSALNNDGIDDLVDFLVRRATPTEAFDIEPGKATNQEPEERAEEIVREKLYRCLHKEVPYQIKQENRAFNVGKNRANGELMVSIDQVLVVRRKSHKELVLGRGNQTLERIRESAVRDLEKEFGCPVDLLLHVKVTKSKNWTI